MTGIPKFGTKIMRTFFYLSTKGRKSNDSFFSRITNMNLRHLTVNNVKNRRKTTIIGCTIFSEILLNMAIV